MKLKSIEEIDEMLEKLDKLIDDWEEINSPPDFGRKLTSPEGWYNRKEYAGLLAQRDFLRRLRLKVCEKKIREEGG